nr:EcsC family protein [Neisseria flavescens]
MGGFFGFSAIMVELPVSTTIMMRSILDVARSEGFDITDPKPNWNAFPYSGSLPTKTNRTTVRKADTTPAVLPLIKS